MERSVFEFSAMIIGVREAIASHKAALLLLHLFTLLLFSSAFYLSTLLLFILGSIAATSVIPSPIRYAIPGILGEDVKYWDISLVISVKINTFALANGKMPFGV